MTYRRDLTTGTAVVTFTVPGAPVPWKRARSYGKRRFNAPEMVAQTHCIQLAVLAAVTPARCAELRDASLFWAIAVLVVLPPKARADTDNHVKLLGDALRGVLYENDLRTVEWHARAVRQREHHRIDVVAVGRPAAPDRPWTPTDMTALLGGAW